MAARDPIIGINLSSSQTELVYSWGLGHFGPFPIRLELQPSFDVSSPFSYCLQSHEILLNKGMKY